MKKSTDHIVAVTGEYAQRIGSNFYTIWCKNCGDRESLALTSSIDFVAEFSKLFLSFHEKCKRKDKNNPVVNYKCYSGDWDKLIKEGFET